MDQDEDRSNNLFFEKNDQEINQEIDMCLGQWREVDERVRGSTEIGNARDRLATLLEKALLPTARARIRDTRTKGKEDVLQDTLAAVFERLSIQETLNHRYFFKFAQLIFKRKFANLVREGERDRSRNVRSPYDSDSSTSPEPLDVTYPSSSIGVRTSALEDFQDYVKRCSLDDFGQDDPRSFLNERECATFVLHYYHQWKKKKIGMVQERPFSGSTWDLSADPDRSRALERVYVSPWLPCWGFSSAKTACTPEAPASERAAHPSATPRDSCRLDWGRHCAGTGGGSGRTAATSSSPCPIAAAGRSSCAAGC